MKNEIIMEKLQEASLNDIEILKSEEEYVLLRFFYDFDDAELDAAKAYSNDESGKEEESEQWFSEFYIPYLEEISLDNVAEVLEELRDEEEMEVQFVSYEMEEEDVDYQEFIVLFKNKEKEIDIDTLLDELEL